MDLGIHQLGNPEDNVVNYKYWNENGGGINNWYMGRNYASGGYNDYWKKDHQFTQVQITDQGLEELQKVVEQVRNVVGTEVPLCVDHFGHIDNNQIIKLKNTDWHGSKT